MYRGSCLCGGINYEIRGEIRNSSHCHCKMCQKGHGAAFASYGVVNRSELVYTKGAELISEYESSDKIFRTFCSRCGANLEWRNGNKPETTDIALGTLDSEFSEVIKRHIYTETKATWLELAE